MSTDADYAPHTPTNAQRRRHAGCPRCGGTATIQSTSQSNATIGGCVFAVPCQFYGDNGAAWTDALDRAERAAAGLAEQPHKEEKQ